MGALLKGGVEAGGKLFGKVFSKEGATASMSKFGKVGGKLGTGALALGGSAIKGAGSVAGNVAGRVGGQALALGGTMLLLKEAVEWLLSPNNQQKVLGGMEKTTNNMEQANQNASAKADLATSANNNLQGNVDALTNQNQIKQTGQDVGLDLG